ncbi:hypothetical protein BSL78_08726 [Apostichopus japonicus]|uniref:Uncharacterized protein n=1 Tax=Stichopus japonicus TaxID=307972 RepID=A0A2G8L2H6_STIJA|nr:hypothetical protein BSL78_08726 [Apostichopus japonicus]
MLFENFVELGKFGNFHSQGIPDNMTDMSNVRNGFHRGNQYPLKDQMYPNVKTFTPPKTDYEFVKGFGDVALNPHLLQANNSFHKAGSNHFQPYTNRPNLNDISKLQTRYQSELSQLYGTNLSGINGNPRGPIPSDSPYNNINHLTNHVGYTGATNNPWYKQNEIHSINALLYQASGITGLPPVPPKRLPNALPSAKIHDGVITSEVEMCKEQVGITLQGSLNGCYNELQNLEGERKKYETDLSQQFMGKRITSSNGIAVTSLPADPTPVDQLICDMYKEYNRIVTLTSKIGGLTKEGLNENIERTLDRWSDAIQKVEGHRRAELSHSLRKLSPESVKQLYSPGNNLIAKLAFLFEITRQVRTALWLSTVYAMHGTDRIASNMRVA